MMIELTLSALQTLIDWDTQALLWINGMHCDYADNLMEMISGRFVWIPLYVSLAVMMFRHFDRRIAAACIVAAVILLVLDDQICSSVVRRAVGRLRPANPDNPISPLVHIVDGYRGGPFGFPSAHSTNSWGLAFLMTYVFRRHLIAWPMALWAVLMCYSRMYLGVHYPGDLLAGMLLGMMLSTMVYCLFAWIYPAAVIELRSRPLRRHEIGLPAMVLAAELLLMAAGAIFIDPPYGI